MADDTRPITPTEAVEDAVRELVERMTEFQAATAYWLLNRNGMTCEKALAIRRRGIGA